MESPTKRSLKLLRSEGFLCHVVEHWNAFAHVRQDAFGFGDILAVSETLHSKLIRGPDTIMGNPAEALDHNYEGVWLIQCTSGDNHAARVKKIRSKECWSNAVKWLRAGGRIAVMSWRKSRRHWIPRFEEIKLPEGPGLGEF